MGRYCKEENRGKTCLPSAAGGWRGCSAAAGLNRHSVSAVCMLPSFRGNSSPSGVPSPQGLIHTSPSYRTLLHLTIQAHTSHSYMHLHRFSTRGPVSLYGALRGQLVWGSHRRVPAAPAAARRLQPGRAAGRPAGRRRRRGRQLGKSADDWCGAYCSTRPLGTTQHAA